MQEPFDLIIKILYTKFNVILQLKKRLALFCSKEKTAVQFLLTLSNNVSPQQMSIPPLIKYEY